MLGTLKKIAGVAIIFSVVFSLLAPGIVSAQGPGSTGTAPALTDDTTTTRNVGGTNITPSDIEAAINSPTPNLANTTAYIFYTISVIMTGTFRDNNNPVSNESPKGGPNQNSALPKTLDQALSQRGLLGGLGFMTAELIRNRPASFEFYAADVARNSRFGAQPAYAQGIGFGALTPILGTWKAFRDVAYYLLTVMFIITGFLILIRHKISGNMAVTVQNALPRLVLTLILITFSYAISGLIVDLMFIMIYFIINIFDTQIFIEGASLTGPNWSDPGYTLRHIAFDENIFGFGIRYIFSGAAYGAADAVGTVIHTALNGLPIVGDILEAPGLSGIFDWIIKQLFAIVFAVAIFIALFRVFFQLIMSYVGFVLNTVLSPLLLLEMTIPGRDPWRGWIRNLIGGLLPFVVAIFMIFMSLALTGISTQPGIGYDPEDPEQSGLRLPLIFGEGMPANAFVGILAMGFMLLLPESIKMAQDLIGAKGGPFDQYKDKAVGALKQGWQGSGVVPGAKQIATGAAVGAGAGIVGGAAGGRVLGGTIGGKIGGERGAFAGRLIGTAGGALAGIAGTPYTAAIGGGISAVGTPMFKGYKTVEKVAKPAITGLDTAATQARDFAKRYKEKSQMGTDATATQGEVLPFDTTAGGTPGSSAPPGRNG